MKDIIITDHALARYKERTGKESTVEDLEKIIRTGPIITLEPAFRGRETASIGGYVWIIRRTSGKTVATTCLGTANDYVLKRPHKRGDTAEVAYAKWKSSQKFKSRRRGVM